MPVNFQDVWRRVRLHVPGAPTFLVRGWVEDAYRRVTDYRGWSWSLIEGQLTWSAARDLAVTTNFGDQTVTSLGLFVSGDAGRQFTVGTWPKYTILQFIDVNTIVLDQPYHGATAGVVTGTIEDAYATLPANFGSFTLITDQVNQRLVPWWVTQEELNLLDPTRTATDSVPRLLAARKLSPYAPTLGQVQYEYWPTPTAAGSLQYYATSRPAALSDAFIFRGVLGERPDVLETGALASAAKWPGTETHKNPYFNQALARQLEEKFQALLQQLDLRDDDQYQQSINNIPWQRFSAYSWAYDCRLLRESDATLSAYFGYLPGGW